MPTDKTEIELMKQVTRAGLQEDNLFRNLSDAEKDYILSDDLFELDMQKLYSMTEAAEIVSRADWMRESVSDATIRHWFNYAPELRLEEYVKPEKVGRRRQFRVNSLIRLKLLCYWHFVKKYSLQIVSDHIFNVERVPQVEWYPGMPLDMTGDISKVKIPNEKVASFMQEWSLKLGKVTEDFVGEQIGKTVQKTVEAVEDIADHHNKLAALQDQTQMVVAEMKIREELRAEALKEWVNHPNRFRKQLFGMVKTEDETAKELFVNDYIKSRIEDKLKAFRLAQTEKVKQTLVVIDEIRKSLLEAAPGSIELPSGKQGQTEVRMRDIDVVDDVEIIEEETGSDS